MKTYQTGSQPGPLSKSCIRLWVHEVIDDLISQCSNTGAIEEEIALRRAKLEIQLDTAGKPVRKKDPSLLRLVVRHLDDD